jgi:hypothetical protein
LKTYEYLNLLLQHPEETLEKKSKTPKTHLKHNVRRVGMAYLVGELR